MSGLIALDHHVSTAAVARRVDDKPATEWSARRRLGFLTVCVVMSWLAVLTPLLLVL